jgi:molybdopterin-guanine dinucleotide biosynthesis protein A
MQRAFGVVLAGGLARRMGGVDKGLVDVCGVPLLGRLVARLSPQCAGLALNANGDPARFAPFALPVFPDTYGDFVGPLAGVLAGMEHVAAHRPDLDAILTVPADTPFAPLDLVARLGATRAAAVAEIAVASSGERTHHAVALWPVSLASDLRRALEDGERKVSAFIARHSNVVAIWPVDPYDPFFNVNRPEDLARAEEIARRV